MEHASQNSTLAERYGGREPGASDSV